MGSKAEKPEARTVKRDLVAFWIAFCVLCLVGFGIEVLEAFR